MVMSDKRKIGALVCAMMVQFFAYGMTDPQTQKIKITSSQIQKIVILFGFAGAAVAGKSENPAFMGVAGLGSAFLAYNYLSKFKIDLTLLDKTGADIKIVKKRIDVDDSVPFDSSLLDPSKMRCLSTEERTALINGIEVNYAHTTAPLAVAFETIGSLRLYVNKKVKEKLLAIKDDAEAEGKLVEWEKIENSRQHCLYVIKKMLLCIKDDSDFRRQNGEYQVLKNTKTQLGIDQQNANSRAAAATAAAINAQAAADAARAQQEKAAAAKSFTKLQWVKWFLSLPIRLFFGGKTE